MPAQTREIRDLSSWASQNNLALFNNTRKWDKTLIQLTKETIEVGNFRTTKNISIYINQIENSNHSTGLAYKKTIIINLLKTKYPYRYTYRKTLGSTSIKSWQEDYVITLAHELRHLDQFKMPEAPYQLEKDAESYAIETLERWRTLKS